MIERILPSIFFVFVVNLYQHIKDDGFVFEAKQLVIEFIEWTIAFAGVLLGIWLLKVQLIQMLEIPAELVNKDLNEIVGTIVSATMIINRGLKVVKNR